MSTSVRVGVVAGVLLVVALAGVATSGDECRPVDGSGSRICLPLNTDILGPMVLLALFAVPLLGIALDIRWMHRRTGTRWGSVDVIWTLSAIPFHVLALLAWCVVGRWVRKRELGVRRPAVPTEPREQVRT